MRVRKSIFWIGVVAMIVIAGLFALNRSSTTSKRPNLYNTAAVEGAPVIPPAAATSSPTNSASTTASPQKPAGKPGVPPASIALNPPKDALDESNFTNPIVGDTTVELTPQGDLRDSPDRLRMMENTASAADDIFAAPPAEEGDWTVNQQGLDQQDYTSADGNADITKWYADGDGGGGQSVQAEEAQLANGEVVDRWYNDNGTVQQVSHQYDANNSYSVYYYDNGQPEAERVIKNGNEIFTKYDRDGHQIQRAYTPAQPDSALE